MASSRSCWTYVAIDAPVKFVGLKLRNHSGRDRPAVGDRLLWNGCWASCGRRTTMHVVTEIDAQRGALSGAQRLQHRVRRPRRVLRRRRAAAHRHRRPHRVHRTQRHPAQSGRAWRARGSPAGSARRSIPARRMQVPFELADGQEREIVFRLGAGRNAGRCAAARRSASAAPAAARGALEAVLAHWQHDARRGAGGDARPVAQLPGQRLAPLPDAGLPHVGAQRLSTSPAARSASAISCRTRWRWSTPSPRCCASSCCAAPAISSAKATSSTGGIRRRAAACARTSRTTICGCRSRRAATSRRPAIPACWTRSVPFLEGRPVQPGGGVVLRPARPLGRSRRRSTSTACARSSMACASARTACR